MNRCFFSQCIFFFQKKITINYTFSKFFGSINFSPNNTAPNSVGFKKKITEAFPQVLIYGAIIIIARAMTLNVGTLPQWATSAEIVQAVITMNTESVWVTLAHFLGLSPRNHLAICRIWVMKHMFGQHIFDVCTLHINNSKSA